MSRRGKAQNTKGGIITDPAAYLQNSFPGQRFELLAEKSIFLEQTGNWHRGITRRETAKACQTARFPRSAMRCCFLRTMDMRRFPAIRRRLSGCAKKGAEISTAWALWHDRIFQPHACQCRLEKLWIPEDSGAKQIFQGLFLLGGVVQKSALFHLPIFRKICQAYGLRLRHTGVCRRSSTISLFGSLR